MAKRDRVAIAIKNLPASPEMPPKGPSIESADSIQKPATMYAMTTKILVVIEANYMEKIKPYAKEILATGAATMMAFIFGGEMLALVFLLVVFTVTALFFAGLIKSAQVERIEKNAKREARRERRRWKRKLRSARVC